jgi:ATPase subunit of ABC transporter with duplicated ATPase domains
VLLGLAAQFLRRPGVLLLDEPTNNLDALADQRSFLATRTFLAEALKQMPAR